MKDVYDAQIDLEAPLFFLSDRKRTPSEEWYSLFMKWFSPCVPFAREGYEHHTLINKVTFSHSDEDGAKKALTHFFREYRKITPEGRFQIPDEECYGYFDYLYFLAQFKDALMAGRYVAACYYFGYALERSSPYDARFHQMLTELAEVYLDLDDTNIAAPMGS